MKKYKLLLTVRLITAVMIIIMLLFPFASAGINIPKVFINESIVADLKYFIAGALYILDSIIYLIINSKDNDYVEYNRAIEMILTDSVLIVLASYGFIHSIIPIVMIGCQIITSFIKENVDVKYKAILNKTKNIFIIVGISLTLLYNLPFELWNLKISDFLLIIAVIIETVTLYRTITTKKMS